MKKTVLLLSGFVWISVVLAQGGFKTLISPEPVVKGEGFRVQYVLEDAEGATGFTAPRFDPFVMITGPDMYTGFTNNGKSTTRNQNYVYTLLAQKTGLFTLKGAKITINGHTYASNDVLVNVVEAKEKANANNSDASFLLPGEDAQEKIRKNLFLKVSVDKKSCFVGEPVVATYSLYSRLRSKSEIVKNPGFYGFGVYDVLNVGDHLKKTVVVNGKTFDEHLLRKVQLYPTQAGQFTIDAMVLSNKIIFSRNAQSKIATQEVTEQMRGSDTDVQTLAAGEEEFETTFNTSPVVVTVKPLPVAKPDSFDGAVGQFRVFASIEKNNLARNEQGFLLVEIKGNGNFIQLAAPRIDWPQGVEGFDATVQDSLDKKSVPLSGSRVFRYGFVAAGPGIYKLPSVRFTYFNPDSNRFVTVQTQPVDVEFTDALLEVKPVAGNAVNSKGTKRGWLVWILLPLVMAPVAWWLIRKNRKGNKNENLRQEEGIEDPDADLFQVAQRSLDVNDPAFYRNLVLACQEFLQRRYGVSGSGLNKNSLLNRPENEEERALLVEWIGVIETCETEMYTGVQQAVNKHALMQQARDLLDKWKSLPG